MSGFFITLEGGEGSGKSTQLSMLASAFENKKFPFLQTREPGGSPGAEALRQLLVRGDADSWDPLSETLLFYAARCNHLHHTVFPALQAGKHVICDRFADSTRVYQGVGKNISTAFVDRLHALTLGNRQTDLTLILDIDPVAGLKRAANRGDQETRFEDMALEFHQRIRAGFLAIAAEEPQRCVVIDATQSPEQMHRDISEALRTRLGVVL